MRCFSASVLLCETAVCFLHVELIGTNVRVPKMRNMPPDVDLESVKTSAKTGSWKRPRLHSDEVFSTWQYCL